MNARLQTLVREERAPAEASALGEAQARFDRAATRLRLAPGVQDLLRSPMREHRVHVPVRMDDGTTKVFEGRVARACRDRGWL